MKFLHKHRHALPRMGLNLVLVGVFAVLALGKLPLAPVQRLENYLYDLRVQMDIRPTQDSRIVILDIDEKSLQAEGHWPWPRDKIGRLLDKLFDQYHIRVIGFDAVFAEADESSGLPVLQRLAENQLKGSQEYLDTLAQIRSQLDYDSLLAESIARHRVILGVYFNPVNNQQTGALPQPAFTREDLHGAQTYIPRAAGYGANLEMFQSRAQDGGHFNHFPEMDGVVRRVPLFYEYEGRFYKSLALAMVQQVLGVEQVMPIMYSDPSGQYVQLEEIHLGNYVVPVDARGRALVPYRGRSHTYPYVSATDVLNDQVSVSLQDAIVLLGTSAPGLADLRTTPMEDNFPGVEIHANLITGILDQRVKAQPDYMRAGEFLLVIMAGLALAVCLPLLSAGWGMLLSLALVAASAGLNLYLWSAANLVLPAAATLVMFAILVLVNLGLGYMVEGRKKSQITHLFGQYVPRELVLEMARDPRTYSQAAETRQMTVLFSDVRGFTTISERLNPTELSTLMNEFLTPLTYVIHHHQGTIDKYMGDAIMAFWGAPVPDAEHARHAVEAGLGMIGKMHDLGKDFQERGLPELRIGVGINTGQMSVGNMGSEFRMAYTVLGDAVNLGSRLEGITKQYGVNIIVGEETQAVVPDYLFRKLDQVRVKGKHEPVSIYEPVGLKTAVSHEDLDELELYEMGLKYYLRQEWDAAETAFQGLQAQYAPRKLYEIYLERLDYFRANPPGELWDGVFTFTTK